MSRLTGERLEQLVEVGRSIVSELDPETLVRRLLDGLNHEEFLDDDYEPSYTDLHVTAVHCYHNLVVIEKGDNREGSNKHIANKRWYARRAAAEASPEFTEP